jgi:hypothetical protein
LVNPISWSILTILKVVENAIILAEHKFRHFSGPSMNKSDVSTLNPLIKRFFHVLNMKAVMVA